MERNPPAKGHEAPVRRFVRRWLPITLFTAGLSLVSAVVMAQAFEEREFRSTEQETRYRELISELRCLVCQNQNLADSNATLAADLRNIVYDMIQEGKSDDEIHAFMVNRYGDFVLYDPPFATKTVALWAGPFLLLALGIWFLLRQIRRRSEAVAAAVELDDTEREKLNVMLRAESEAMQRPRDN